MGVGARRDRAHRQLARDGPLLRTDLDGARPGGCAGHAHARDRRASAPVARTTDSAARSSVVQRSGGQSGWPRSGDSRAPAFDAGRVALADAGARVPAAADGHRRRSPAKRHVAVGTRRRIARVGARVAVAESRRGRDRRRWRCRYVSRPAPAERTRRRRAHPRASRHGRLHSRGGRRVLRAVGWTIHRFSHRAAGRRERGCVDHGSRTPLWRRSRSW